jgi:putative phosphoribosyl transferase
VGSSPAAGRCFPHICGVARAGWEGNLFIVKADFGEKVFRNREEAGRLLARALTDYAGREDVVVFGLPRGGVPVAAEVARALGAPLDVLVVRKLGAPGQEELALGAIGEGGVRVLNEHLVRDLGLSGEAIDRIAGREERELERRVAVYRGGHEALEVEGKTVIVVDDGVATGATMRAGLQTLRALGASRIVAAAPVGAADSVALLEDDADDVVVLETPAWFSAVGQWYEDFGQTSDEEVRGLLARNRKKAA